MRYKRKLIYLIIPFIIAGVTSSTIAFSMAEDGALIETEYKSAYEIQRRKDRAKEVEHYIQEGNNTEHWLKDNEVSIMVFLTLLIPIGGWVLTSIHKSVEKQKEAGRQQFLTLATTTITDSVSERLVAKLEMLEERIEWIYKEISNFESKLHVTDNEVNQMRLELSRLTTDVKVLRATRREFLHRLNEQLQAAEQRLCRPGNEGVPQIKRIEDPFDNGDNDTLF